jgi:GNAT superfamily N-acetyltransferase
MDTRPIAITIRLFRPTDQDAARGLILAGLGERWGWIDPTRNPDLDDIAAAYGHGWFVVALVDGALVGTGALIPEAAGVGRIVRMSVRQALRGQGIGRRILAELAAIARRAGYHTLVLETTSSWTDAVRFYARNGFTVTQVDAAAAETHMALRLDDRI